MKNISINISTYFILFMAFLAGYLKYFLIIYGIILFHELGHILFFKLFKIPILKVVIYPFGGMCYIDKKIHNNIFVDMLCSLGGIIFQLILLVLMIILFKNNIISNTTYEYFLMYNRYILIFNLIPIIPLDGSKLLFAIMTNFISFAKSYKLIGIISFISFICFFLYNIRIKANDLIIYTFLIFELLEWIKNYKFILNKFYLERMISDHYYNEIINNENNINNFKINKYYYIYSNGKYIDEKKYIKNQLFSN